MYSILAPVRPAIDDHWFNQLLPLATLASEIYSYLPPTIQARQAAHDQFYASGMQTNPAQIPDLQYRSTITEHAAGLTKLRAKIQKQETNEAVRTIYIQRIDELRTNCGLWLAAAEQNMEKFAASNTKLYGSPDRQIYAAVCAWVREQAARHAAHASIGVREAAQEVLRIIPDEAADPKSIIPDETAFAALYNLHFSPGSYMDQLFAGTFIAPDHPVGQREGDAIIHQVLKNIGVRYTIADAPDIYWRIQHSARHVVRPAEYHMNPDTFRAIIAHEVGSHLLEYANGLRGPLHLLASGLAHYEHGNEGRAYMREQLAAGSITAALQDEGWQLCVAKHLGISLACGYNGHKYTFSEVYAVLSALHTFWLRLQQPERQLEADENAREHAWNLTCRLLVGTNGLSGAYLKDTVYLEGNVRCWQEAKRNPAHILKGDMGKFDICNPEQVGQLQALGILP
ncbi:MAG TPA: tyrosine/phenylalanine carboxypeptidase domain-containing protein [Candidatus Saccharimonadales bacterium]|nr:tyrosine/phenylalanine carboxypeptidase domain-containing protein [Candidatus Saccharimonadales bacterium]